jgi:hypothetical protein
MAEVIHVLATFESQEALLNAMAHAVSWGKITEAEALQVLAPEPADPYASTKLRPGLERMKQELAQSLFPSEGGPDVV